jgi:hypothetical protein
MSTEQKKPSFSSPRISPLVKNCMFSLKKIPRTGPFFLVEQAHIHGLLRSSQLPKPEHVLKLLESQNPSSTAQNPGFCTE